MLANGVPPDRIVWVRPRDPWMLNRAVVQPDPVVALGLAADTMAAAADAESLDDLFLRLEAAGVMLRIDRDVIPTMAKTPTLGAWELDLLRTIEHVVRLGHIKHVTRREIVLDEGSVPLAPGSLVVHCAASGLQYPPAGSPLGAGQDPTPDDPGRLPVLQRGAGRLRGGNPRRRPRAQPVVSAQHPPRQPGQLGADAGSWNRRDAQRYGAEPDIAAWANGCALNPARIEPSQRDDPAVQAAAARLADHAEHGLARMAELAADS